MTAPRTIAAALGLLGFCVSIFGGLWVGNPAMVVLSRALLAMVLFAIIGLVTGCAARIVVREYVADRERALLRSEEAPEENKESLQQEKTLSETDAEPMGT
ncbi:MAG: hypothetical protein V3W34_14940 [Phycisphaerae bacterium]